MKIGLVSYRSENKNIPFNLTQIERALKETQGQAELLCFGEAFLQGFDSLCWDYETDRQMAVEQNAETMDYLRGLTIRYGTGQLQADLPGLEGIHKDRQPLPRGNGNRGIYIPREKDHAGPLRGYVGLSGKVPDGAPADLAGVL